MTKNLNMLANDIVLTSKIIYYGAILQNRKVFYFLFKIWLGQKKPYDPDLFIFIVQRSKWCSTLQERVKEQLVFGRPRFGPGSHCQKSGSLELKGTKSKIYTAIIMEQIWLYKSEQVIS